MPKKSKQEATETVEQMLSELQAAETTDTVSDLMDVYEAIERSYRAAVMAGEATPHVAYSTNY